MGENYTLNPGLALLDEARKRIFYTEPRWNWALYGDNLWDWELSRDRHRQAETEKAIAIDCWKYGNKQCTSKIDYIDDDKLEGWAKQTTPTEEGEPPRAGLRLIHKCARKNLDLPFSFENFAAITKALGIPRVDLSYASRQSGACGTIFTPDHNHPVMICQRSGSDLSVTSIIRYDPQANITVGYIISGTRSEIHPTLLAIPVQFDLCEHPLLIPVIVTEQIVGVCNSFAADILDGLTGIEQSFYQPDSMVTVRGGKLKEHSWWLSTESRRYSLLQAQLHYIELRNVYLGEQLKELDSWMPSGRLQELQKSGALLKERLAFNKSTIQHLRVCDGIEMRLDAQKTLLFNLISQEDNRVNLEANKLNILISRDMREMAVKAKKDGSTMKLIAVLGTVFLPSTFLSTFFAMPLLDWNAPTAGTIVGKYFWIYWAFAIPLTLVTMALVGLWILVRNRAINDDGDDDGDGDGDDDDDGKDEGSQHISNRSKAQKRERKSLSTATGQDRDNSQQFDRLSIRPRQVRSRRRWQDTEEMEDENPPV